MAETFNYVFGAYEQQILRNHVLGVLCPSNDSDHVTLSRGFLRWYRKHASTLGIEIKALNAAALGEEKKNWNALESEISICITCEQIESQRHRLPAKSALQKRLDWVASTLNLTENEFAVLEAAVRFTMCEPFQQFISALGEREPLKGEMTLDSLTKVCRLGRNVLRALLQKSSTLVQMGLIEDSRFEKYSPSGTVLKIVGQPTTNGSTLTSILLGKREPARLTIQDFVHLGAAIPRSVEIIRGAISAKEVGASLLLYGPPGTGKTEFARSLSEAVGAQAVFVGEISSKASEPTRADRLAHLAFLSALGDRAGRILLIIDEADDIFAGMTDERFPYRSGSKVFMNRIVENCPVPSVWISNDPECLGQSVVRRMLHTVEFREPDRAARRRIVARLASDQQVVLTDDQADRLATLPASPAVINSGLRATRLTGGDVEVALETARSISRALGRSIPPSPPDERAFNISLCSADTDLMRLEERVMDAGPGALSFLFSGLPGTGKSAFARHLASMLGLEVLQKRGSDLLGRYVGESEKQIKAAFEEAADRRMFLIFDEADSLLFNRSEAHRRWEISQVNEMLTWMERHPCPFAATTNLAERLDPATQRRFLFRVKFAPMNHDQVARAFRELFSAEPPTSLARIDLLTPGDFALVARRAAVLGETDPQALAAMLASEASAKVGASHRPIGFSASIAA